MTNPTSINQTYNGRKASYVAGVLSPAVYYWSLKHGDKAEMRRRGHIIAEKGFSVVGFVCGKKGADMSRKYVRGVYVNSNGYWFLGNEYILANMLDN